MNIEGEQVMEHQPSMLREGGRPSSRQIVVAIPCYNEAQTIGKVVEDFRRELPEAEVVVFDNGSSDDSPALAAKAGARVRPVLSRGKGHVMQAIFEDIDVDALVVVDGDDTYPAEVVRQLVGPVLEERADMVVGTRLESADDHNMRRLHRVGNQLLLWTLNFLFKTQLADLLSGYRVFSRRFVRSVPLLLPGFETETELTIQALERRMIVHEVLVPYRSRPRDSASKLRPFRDGYRILLTMLILMRDHRPFRLFALAAIVFVSGALVAGVLQVLSQGGDVFLPLWLINGLLVVFVVLAGLSFSTALILNAINTRMQEIEVLMRHRRS